ncbi:MAG: hypothetical protein H6Q73_468 [Firmicutes bacterium]|nr:hypothetical protein [Bacillota bacterium]
MEELEETIIVFGLAGGVGLGLFLLGVPFFALYLKLQIYFRRKKTKRHEE